MHKIRRGRCFRGVVTYALAPASHHKTAPVIIGGNMIGLSVDEVTVEFMRTQKLRSDVQKPVWHNSLRLPAGEILTKQEWVAVADDYMKRMGFSDTHLRCYVLHDDEAGQHIHIIASRIRIPDGQLYLGRNENLISTRIIQELELDHQLTRTIGPPPAIQPKKQSKLTRNEKMMQDRTGEKPSRKVIQEAIDAILTFFDTITIEDFINELLKQNISATANIASTGKMNGFSFEHQGFAFKASQLGKAYTWLSLSKRVILTPTVEPQVICDTELPVEELEAVVRLANIDDEPVFQSSAIPHIEEINTEQKDKVRWLLWVPYLKQVIQALKATGLSLLKPLIKMRPLHFVTPYQSSHETKSLTATKEIATEQKKFSI